MESFFLTTKLHEYDIMILQKIYFSFQRDIIDLELMFVYKIYYIIIVSLHSTAMALSIIML